MPLVARMLKQLMPGQSSDERVQLMDALTALDVNQDGQACAAASVLASYYCLLLMPSSCKHGF
jgi:hypothetical protein